MSYKVLARKWRPQRFEDVIGQAGVTDTLRNAIRNGRVAQAFVFAGPRGVGKTTSARILAKALNCVNGPTPEPCGTCEACVEIADGRDIDVLEIDAATHTQVDKVREVIVSGLAIPPVRDRHKIFIIDEVHQLSAHSFNALLKSIEEPPPHIVFMMATTELQKIPDTILSRSQVHEFRTLTERAITGQLRKIAGAEGLSADEAALSLVARAADGSMRDALTAFDQVVAFAGETISVEDVSSVLGLVGRNLLLDIVTAVADERAPAAFELAGRAIEAGYDLRLLCRELSRLVRDMMLVSVDARRLDDPEVVPAGERGRVEALLGRFSREDLLRAFDLVARTEAELRAATDPRYHLEMALLKWIHLRKLTPLADLIEQLQQAGSLPAPVPGGRPAPPFGSGAPARRPPPSPSAPPASPRAVARPVPARPEPPPPSPEDPPSPKPQARPSARQLPSVEPAREAPPPVDAGGSFKEAFLAEVRRAKVAFYQMVVAQAHRIDVEGDRIVFVFTPVHRMMKDQLDQNRAWLEPLAARVAGRRVQVLGALAEPAARTGEADAADGDEATEAALRSEAASDTDLKSLLELIPAEIKDVEKI